MTHVGGSFCRVHGVAIFEHSHVRLFSSVFPDAETLHSQWFDFQEASLLSQAAHSLLCCFFEIRPVANSCCTYIYIYIYTYIYIYIYTHIQYAFIVYNMCIYIYICIHIVYGTATDCRFPFGFLSNTSIVFFKNILDSQHAPFAFWSVGLLPLWAGDLLVGHGSGDVVHHPRGAAAAAQGLDDAHPPPQRALLRPPEGCEAVGLRGRHETFPFSALPLC